MRLTTALLAASLIALVGCGGKTNQDSTTTGGSTTVTTNQGSVTIGKADASKLGAPVYPGAASDDNGSVSIAGATEHAAMASFKTSDDFDKVYQYYKGQMPNGSEKLKMAAGDTQTAMFVVGDDKNPKAEQTSVQIQGKAGETDIMITHKDAQP